MASFKLPGIKNIQIISCAALPPGAMLKSICGVTIPLSCSARTLEFVGKPSLSWDTSKKNGKMQQKSTLEFSSREVIREGSYWAFVVTCVDGTQYLVGTREANYPEITYSETTGSPDRDAAIRTYKVSHIAQKSVLPCLL